MAWRAYIGVDWDTYPRVDWAHLDEVHEAWVDARDVILRHLERYVGDGCPDCRQRAASEASELRVAEPGPWEGEVDGETYAIGWAA